MKVARKLIFCISCCLLITVSQSAFAGLDDGTSSSPNPTGGFGTSSTTGTDGASTPNPVGGFGSSDPMPLATPPPPPPEPVPLDGGAFALIAAGLGIGARKIYKGIKGTNTQE